jgi:hypothetical protein
MQTVLGSPYTPPTPEEFQALVRKAHTERAEAVRELLTALFIRRREAEVADVPLRPAA